MRFLVLALLLCATQTLQAQDKVTIAYLGARQGETEPCGCKVNQNGGLNRLFERLNQLKKKGRIVFLDAGDTFFTMPRLNPNRIPLERLKSELIAKSYREMGLSAFSPGEKDFALGVETLLGLLSQTGAELVSANLEFPKASTKVSRFKILEANGIKILVTGLTSFENAVPDGVKVLPAEESLQRVFSSGEKADRIVVLSHLGQREDEKLAGKYPGVFVLGSKSKNIFLAPQAVGQGFVFEAGYDGQRLGEIEISKNQKNFISATITDLSKDYEKANSVKKLMQEYSDRLAKLPSNGPPSDPSKKSFVADPQQCKTCHEEQFNFWKNTKHSSAILVLYAKNQHYNPDCIGCHSLGYQTPEGFSDVAGALLLKMDQETEKFTDAFLKQVFIQDPKKPLDSRQDPRRYQQLHQRYWSELTNKHELGEIQKNFLGVQCEHCHGNRAEHVRMPAKHKTRVSTESCVVCHRAPNAPDFDPKTVAQVSCPKIRK